MSASASVLLATGLSFSFVSQEILEATVGRAEQTSVVVMQLLGAAYLGLAFLNWMNRGASLGGIYGRPLTMPNFLHFATAAITLVKLAQANPDTLLVATAAIASLFAAWFGAVVFTPPPIKQH